MLKSNKPTEFVYVVDHRNECIEKHPKENVIPRNSESSYVKNLGYYSNQDIYSSEEKAKDSLRTLLLNRFEIIKSRLAKLGCII